MSKKPSLPSRPEDTWEGGFVLDRAQRVWSVSGSGGLVVGGGQNLFLLRPGAQRWHGRDPIAELGKVVAVAAEPKQPWRYAVSSTGGIAVYGLPKDQKLTLTAPPGEPVATHLAWGTFEKQRVLYVRWADGGVGRVRLDLGEIENLPVMPMDALAADANGVVALVALHGDEPHALVTRDGVRFEERPAVGAPADVDVVTMGTSPPNPGKTVHLAVADTAIAYAVEGWGTYLSRGIDDDFLPVAPLAPGGPLAFQGTAAGAALFGAIWQRSVGAIHRVDAQGAVQRIAETSSDGADAPRLTSLSWDASRHTLWSASPEAGVMRNEEPRGKAGKKRVLS